MKIDGKVMSGMRSTRSRLYEKRPSTHSATITMVAKTGWLMLVRVIHMAVSLAGLRFGVVLRFAGGFTAGVLRIAGAPGLSPVTRALTTCRPLSSPLFTSTRPGLRLGRADLHRALADLAVLDGEDVRLARPRRARRWRE